MAGKSSLTEKFGDVVDGLLSLEVNTVVKANMVATRMPTMPLALRDTALEYWSWLKTYAPTLAGPPDPIAKAYFAETLLAAADAVQARTDVARAQQLLAARISDSCKAIGRLWKGVMETAQPTPDDRLQMRKIWELGTESVELQTVIWIDGDVTQRIREGIPEGQLAQLFGVHRVAVKTSIRVWKELASVITSVFEALWKSR